MKDHLRIVQLVAENYKRLRAVEITPAGDIVTIAGRNAQGKTSILDAIWSALAHADHVQAMPIRAGATAARIRLDLGELKVERRFTEKGTTLTIENGDGARFPSPQKMLDDLIGALSFDPLAFVRMKAPDQFTELKSLAGVKLDFDKLAALNKSDYERRTDVNRRAKQKRDTANAIAIPAADNSEGVDEDGLLDQLQQAAEHNDMIASRTAARQAIAADAARLHREAKAEDESAARLQVEVDNMLQRIEQATQERAKRLTHAAETEALAAEKDRVIATSSPLPPPVDVSEVREKLDAAKKLNAGRAQAQLANGQKAEFTQQAEALEAESRAITDAMDARLEQKADAIKNAKMPVAGLGFGDGVLTFNGVPLDQASSADQLKISLSIAMAANPKLRVLRIQDGSLLDSDSLATIAKMAGANDYQVWLERVDETGKIGITIEDGEVVAVNEPATDQQPGLALET